MVVYHETDHRIGHHLRGGARLVAQGVGEPAAKRELAHANDLSNPGIGKTSAEPVNAGTLVGNGDNLH